MMDKNKFDELIDEIDNNIKKYSDNFNFEKKSLETQLKNTIHILNERTVASTINYYLYETLNRGYNIKLAVNEFPIKLTNEISETDMDELLLEVNEETDKTKWKNCYVDGFFKIENFYFPVENYLFIEYKLEKKFKLVQLATDYLKYKIYTKNDDKKTIFTFVVCDKKENYPTIINDKTKKFHILDRRLDILLPLDTRIYVYIPTNDSASDEDNIDEKDLYELFNELNIISKKADYIDQFSEKEFKVLENYQKVFIENMHKFNSKVIKANYIRKNYNFICSLWEKSKEILSNDGIYLNLNFTNKDEEHIIELIDDGSRYFSNYQNNLYGDNLIEAKNSGVKASNYTSFNIIVLLDFFNEAILKTEIKPEYYETTTIRGRNKESITYEEIAYNHKEKLKGIYCRSEFELNKIKRLALEIMYFIVNVYPILFEISAENEVIDESINKKISDSLQIIQKSINRVKKLINYRDKINILDSDVDIQIRGIVEDIIRKY